jgi:uncharacterized protein (TIGR03067 family)
MRQAMRWVAALAVVAVAMAGAASVLRADDVKVSGDLKKMQGTWVRAGDEGPESKWVIEGDSLKATVNNQDYTCKLTNDPKATPHPSLDIVIKEGPGDTAGKTSKAIYKFDGEKLVLCISHPGGETRPAEFKTVENEAFMIELKKEN